MCHSQQRVLGQKSSKCRILNPNLGNPGADKKNLSGKYVRGKRWIIKSFCLIFIYEGCGMLALC